MRPASVASCLFLACIVASVGACGGPPAASAHSSADGAERETPAARCLAIAAAARGRRPDEPAKITAKHVLVKHAGARNAPALVTRSREDACLRAQEARAQLESGASFAEVVTRYSEEPGAASREGSIGVIGRSDVVPSFADAAFELRPGEVSHVVESPFGFHVIVRTE